MAKNLSLEEQFPEFTQSVLEDIRKQNGGNFLEMMKQDTEKMKKTKIDEVEANFPTFDRKVVEETLASNDWDVPRAIFALIQLQEKNEKEKKGDEHKKAQEERLRKQREESKQFLLKMFDNLPAEVIQKVLDDNEGDVDIATTQLIDLVENQQKEKRVEQERELTINTIFDKFSENITRDEVVQVFHQQHFDVKQTTVARPQG